MSDLRDALMCILVEHHVAEGEHIEVNGRGASLHTVYGETIERILEVTSGRVSPDDMIKKLDDLEGL